MTGSEPTPTHAMLQAIGESLKAFGSEPATRLQHALATLDDGIRPVDAGLSPTCEWLKEALSTHPAETASLLDLIVPLIGQMQWHDGPRPGAPEGFDGGYAYVLLTGPDGQIPSEECRVGLYLQRPGLHYPAHGHEAEELYLILTGSADWQAGDHRFTAKPGQLIHHPSEMPHVMTTQDAPLFAFFAWLGKIEGDYWFL